MVRYADDVVMCFGREDDARRVLEVLPKRLERYGLSLHPEKTRMVEFRRPPHKDNRPSEQRPPRPGTFDFLGFTHYWGRSRKGTWVVKRKTMKSRFSRALSEIARWCSKARHLPVREQHRILTMKMRGHDAYYGITGNARSLAQIRYWVERIWKKWLSRRSRKAQMNWERFAELLRRYPLPPPVVVHSIYRQSANP